MLSRVDGVWMEEGGEEDAASWTQAHLNPAGELGSEAKGVLQPPSFRSMLEDDWYINMSPTSASFSHHGGFEGLQTHPDIKDITFPADPPLLPPPVDSSSSSFFNLDASQPFFTSKTAISFRLNPFGFDPGFLPPPQMSTSPVFMNRDPSAASGVLGLSGQMGCSGLSPGSQFSVPGFTSGAGLHPMGFENSPLLNRSKVLGSLDILPRVGAPPTLFQKRAAALRQNAAIAGEQGGSLSLLCSDGGGQGCHEKRREKEEEEIDGSSLNYYSDEAMGEESAKNGSGGGNNSNDGEHKGKKKKGVPAKNLMAERRRRKKLNDRLYMLRSIVPKISKMDRTSILGDAIEYLKELMQRINDLHNELESAPSSSSLPATNSTSFQPSTPTPPTLPCCVKELCPSSLPSPNNQPARVDVRVREGRAVNIHMFCPRRPGVLLSTMRALDGLGLDIQQAVISCFNGFALDVFRAEQCKDGLGVLPDEIQAVLLQSVGFHGMM